MNKLTQEELNGLSPRARKAYEESNSVLSEITVENPNAEQEDKPKKKKEKETKEMVCRRQHTKGTQNSCLYVKF